MHTHTYNIQAAIEPLPKSIDADIEYIYTYAYTHAYNIQAAIEPLPECIGADIEVVSTDKSAGTAFIRVFKFPLTSRSHVSRNMSIDASGAGSPLPSARLGKHIYVCVCVYIYIYTYMMILISVDVAIACLQKYVH